jgi:hypothetical protein
MATVVFLAEGRVRDAGNLCVAPCSGESPPVFRARSFVAALLGAASLTAVPARPVEARPSAPKAQTTPRRQAPQGKVAPSPVKDAPKPGPARAKSPSAPLAKTATTPPVKGTIATAVKTTPPPPRPRENAYLEVPDRAYAESTVAYRYANLSDQEALAELARRRIDWVVAEPPLPGVRTPIRLAGPLRGVDIHSSLPPAERAGSPFEILDARLALSLDDFCALLARHDVVELVHYTMYRPPADAPADGQKQIRHPAGLAIDVGALRKRDGSWLAVGPHWPSNIGAKTCGDGAVEHWAREARELASIVCETKDERLFHFALTPDFNADHADHVHLEIKPDTRWFIVN